MKLLILLALFSENLNASECDHPLLQKAGQVILNIVAKNNTTNSKTYLIEKNELKDSFQAVIGRAGLSEMKREGDGKSPAGVYRLTEAFGLENKLESIRLPYTRVSENSHCIDDKTHNSYNRILYDFKKPKGLSSENLLDVGAPYEFAVVVDYNFLAKDNKSSPVPGNGSCIFLHVWKKDSSGEVKPTAGCTAFSRTHMKKVLNWLDPKKSPVLVQLTKKEYLRNYSARCLPKIL